MSKGSGGTRATNSRSAHGGGASSGGGGNTVNYSPDTKKLFDLQEKYDIAKAAADAAQYRGNIQAIEKAIGEVANAGYELNKAIRENPKGSIYKE